MFWRRWLISAVLCFRCSLKDGWRRLWRLWGRCRLLLTQGNSEHLEKCVYFCCFLHLFFLCVACVLVCVCAYLEARGQPLMSHTWTCLLFFLFGQGFSLAWNLSSGLCWLASQPQLAAIAQILKSGSWWINSGPVLAMQTVYQLCYWSYPQDLFWVTLMWLWTKIEIMEN